MPLLTLNVLAPGDEQPNFDLFIYIRYAVPPYSARISATYTKGLQSLVGDTPTFLPQVVSALYCPPFGKV